MFDMNSVDFLVQFTTLEFEDYCGLEDNEVEACEIKFKELNLNSFNNRMDAKDFYAFKKTVAEALKLDMVKLVIDNEKPNKLYKAEAYNALMEMVPELSKVLEEAFGDKYMDEIHLVEGVSCTFYTYTAGNSVKYVYDVNGNFLTFGEDETEPEVENASIVAEENEPIVESNDVSANSETPNPDFSGVLKNVAEEIKNEEKGEKEMNKEQNVVKTAKERMVKAAKSAKTKMGEDRQAFVDSCDKALDEIKNSLTPVLQVIDDATGATVLKEEICGIIYKTVNDAKSKRDFFDMAKKIREKVDSRIEKLSKLDPEDKLGKVAKLRTVNTTAIFFEDGSSIEEEDVCTQTIWMAFAKSIVWVCKKVVRKLRRWFGTNAETNVFGAVGAGIADAFSKLGKVFKSVAKMAGTVTMYVASYIVAGVFTLAAVIIEAIKSVVSKIKGWIETRKNKVKATDVAEDIAEEEELEEEFFDDEDEEDTEE